MLIRGKVSRILTSSWLYRAGLALLVQQLLVASSNLWMLRMVAAVETGRGFKPYLALYLGSLILPYLPGALVLVWLACAKQESLARWVDEFARSHKNSSSLWLESSIRTEKIPMLSVQGPQELGSFIDFIYDVGSFGLNILFNIVTISIALDFRFAVAFLIGFSGVAAIMKAQGHPRAWLAEIHQSAQVSLTDQLGSAWDSVVLGNAHNFRVWWRQAREKLHALRAVETRFARFNQSVSALISVVGMLPTLLLAAYLLTAGLTDRAAILGMLALLPRIFSVLNYAHSLLHTLADWPSHHVRLNRLEKVIQRPEPVNLVQRVRLGDISVVDERNHRAVQASDLISRPAIESPLSSPGRWTLRGENGCGKTSLLLVLKEKLGSAAFLLPAHCQAAFSGHSCRPGSTGEILARRLVEIEREVTAPVLLLDEWDANLDSRHFGLITSRINELARNRCIIEVRHRS